jgi:hypothetical protein
MRNRGLIGVGVLGVVLSGAVTAAQDLSRYREFELGSSVAAVSILTGVAGSEPCATLLVGKQSDWDPLPRRIH